MGRRPEFGFGNQPADRTAAGRKHERNNRRRLSATWISSPAPYSVCNRETDASMRREDPSSLLFFAVSLRDGLTKRIDWRRRIQPPEPWVIPEVGDHAESLISTWLSSFLVLDDVECVTMQVGLS